jgi:YD repeat-containing protein
VAAGLATSAVEVHRESDNPCTTANDPANQAGMAKTSADPPAANGVRVTTETVYDAAGRTVATRTNGDPWTCTAYDARDRVASHTFPHTAAHPPAPSPTTTPSAAIH